MSDIGLITMKFDIYSKEEKIGRCEIVDSKLIKNEVYSSDYFRMLASHPFLSSKNFFSVAECLKDRVMPECRWTPELLNHEGLKEFNVYEILRKTHGVSMNDFTWFKFDEDPESLCYEDVRAR